MLKENWDVIVIGGVLWKQFSDGNRKKIIEMVEKGAGLIYIDPSQFDKRLLGERKKIKYPLQMLPLKILPVLKDIPESDLLESYTLRKGKVIIANYPLRYAGKQWTANFLLPASLHYDQKKSLWTRTRSGKGEYNYISIPEVADFDFWEYYYAFLSKLLLTAAKREPKIKIASLQISRGIPKIGIGTSVELKLQLSGDIQRLVHPKAKVIIKDKHGGYLYIGEVSLTCLLYTSPSPRD